MILGSSRMAAVRFATDKTRVTTLAAIVRCVDDLGGASAEFLTDRDTALMSGSRADGSPVFASDWVDVAAMLGTRPRACRPYRAKTKGRVERLWGTFQDRLVVELRLAGVVDRDGANAYLVEYLARHNARFGVPAADPLPAWRPLPDDVRLERVLVFKYRRKVAKDHTIQLAGRVLQLPRGAAGAANYAGKRVEVHVALDGSIVAYDGERRLAVAPAPPDPVQLRATDARRVTPSLVPAKATVPWTPPRDHPWKRVTPGSKLEKRLTESLGS